MKLGPRTNGHASLKLVKPTALPAHMRGDVIELKGLRTAPNYRGQGYASDLMRAVCAEADTAQRFLFLCVEPGDGLEFNDLAQFYARLGFMPIQAAPMLMARPHIAVRGMMLQKVDDHDA